MPLIGVDGCHLQGLYEGELLCSIILYFDLNWSETTYLVSLVIVTGLLLATVSTDANDNMFPIA